MTRPVSLPFRQIHLDFHTGPGIPDVGAEFDAQEFARTLKRARVNSINLFAKCHHGHLYYNTERPERHPGLPKDLDLLGLQVEALRREGIKAPIYISVQCDEYAANHYPQWVARQPDTGQVKGGGSVFAPGWQIMDMSTPYQEYLAEQTREILDRFKPVDGIWFDMCWDQPSCSREAIDGIRKRGLNPESAEDRQRYAHEVAQSYMRRFHAMVMESSPEALVFFNCRPFPYLPEEIDWFEQIEIEALPTGGWGYLYFPANVRRVRHFGKPYLGMTARFHKGWADFGGLKPYAALEYETAQMVAHGAQCSIGDQLHPRGTLDRAAYERIGQVYRRIEEREPWLEGAIPVAQIGVLQQPFRSTSSLSDAEAGTTRLLTQLKHLFDFTTPQQDWSGYELLILPDTIPVDTILAARLNVYLHQGGKLLATGLSGLSADGAHLLLSEFGVTPVGLSPYTTTYFRVGDEISIDIPTTDHVMYERGVRIKPKEGTTTLAQVVEPYFERAWDHFCSHKQTPPDQVSPYAAAVRRGQVAYIAFPIFSAFAKHANAEYRLLVRNIIDQLLPDRLLRLEAPTGTEATLTRQPGRSIVHLLHYCPERRADGIDLVEDIIPLYNIPLTLRLEQEPARVYTAPDRAPLPYTYQDGYASVRVSEVRGHAMIVFEETS